MMLLSSPESASLRGFGVPNVDNLLRITANTVPTTSSHAVELFGVPRLLVGQRAVTAAGATLAELAADLVQRSPVLAGRVLEAGTGWPLAGYAFVVDERFTRDRAQPINEGTSVILVASAAGG
jgi:molybdopterin converting factor small subunit